MRPSAVARFQRLFRAAAGVDVAGGLTFALARAFTIIEPERRNPQTDQWIRVTDLFDLLL